MYNTRLDELRDYPFQRLNTLLEGLEPPKDRAPINLSIGEPQHAGPPWVAEILSAEAAAWGRYPPTPGTHDFRQAVADWLARRFRLPPGFVHPDRNVLPVAGTREALFNIALYAVPPVPGGERPVVLVPDPFYQIYAGAAAIAGAEAVFLPTDAGTGHLPDFAAVPEDILRRTALAYVCSPSNPQGAVADQAYWERLIERARAHDFLVAADECYAELYSTEPPTGILEACAAQDDLSNVVTFHSLSKRSSVPGLRSGFVAGDPEVIRGYGRLRTYTGNASPLPVLAAATALWRDEEHVEANRALYRAKFDLAEAILGERFDFRRPAGGFYIWLDVGDGEKTAVSLWREQGVRVLPGAYLSRGSGDGSTPGDRHIRAALVHDIETTEAALVRLAEGL